MVDNVNGRLYHNGLQHRRSFAHHSREHRHGDNFHLKQSNYPSQYYPDLSPMEMCNLLQGMQDDGEEDGDNDRLELDDNAAHFINTLTIRDVQLLLLQGLYCRFNHLSLTNVFLCLMIYTFIPCYLFNAIENYMNVPRNKVLGGSNEKQYMTRRMQTRTQSNAINSEDNFRVSEDRLARIANWHHLPRYN